eukprot:15283885-Alexandrium_andersonii.AAC.1
MRTFQQVAWRRDQRGHAARALARNQAPTAAPPGRSGGRVGTRDTGRAGAWQSGPQLDRVSARH